MLFCLLVPSLNLVTRDDPKKSFRRYYTPVLVCAPPLQLNTPTVNLNHFELTLKQFWSMPKILGHYLDVTPSCSNYSHFISIHIHPRPMLGMTR